MTSWEKEKNCTGWERLVSNPVFFVVIKRLKPWGALKKASESLKRLLCPEKDRCVWIWSVIGTREEKVMEEAMDWRRNAVSMVVNWPNPAFWGHTRCEPDLWFVKMFWTTYSRREDWCTSNRMKGRELRLLGVGLWRKALGLKRTVSVPWSQEGWTWDAGTSATVSEVCLSWKVQRLMCVCTNELVIVTNQFCRILFPF